MIKKFLSTAFLLLIASLLFGCSEPGKEINNLDTYGSIFVAAPSKSNDYYTPFFEDISSFHKQFESRKFASDRVVPLSYRETGYDDIWIRDVAPVITSRLVKFVYAPQYLPEDVSQSLNDDFTTWLTNNHFEFIDSPLILDGGNLIWNNDDTVILTTRILEDNPKRSREEIIDQLKADLIISRVILIPPEAGDVLAHADGMVKFIDKNTMFISDFLGDDDFRKQVEKIILAEMPSAKFVVIPSAYTEQGQYDNEIASAKGLYINMLETDHALYVPQFRLPEDKEMLAFIEEYSVKPVIVLDMESLSTMGGAVNCLTWYCPNQFIPINLR